MIWDVPTHSNRSLKEQALGEADPHELGVSPSAPAFVVPQHCSPHLHLSCSGPLSNCAVIEGRSPSHICSQKIARIFNKCMAQAVTTRTESWRPLWYQGLRRIPAGVAEWPGKGALGGLGQTFCQLAWNHYNILTTGVATPVYTGRL